MIAAASARPDVSHLPTGSYLPSSGSNVIGSSSFGSNGYDHGFNGGNFGSHGNFGGNGNFGNNGNFGGNFGGGYNTQDQKQVYFYAAPEDDQASRLRIQVAPSSHKNTKVIFVKAPGGGAVIPEVIAPPSQSEDKTLVYVLVKKQDQGGSITIPSTSNVKSAKPEVFFIKYKTQQEAEQAVSSTLNGQSQGSLVQDLRDEQTFIRTIKDSAGIGNIGGGNLGGGNLGGIFLNGGGDGGISGGSSILGTSSGSSIISGGDSGTRYGTPGASGPYKR